MANWRLFVYLTNRTKLSKKHARDPASREGKRAYVAKSSSSSMQLDGKLSQWPSCSFVTVDSLCSKFSVAST